MRPVIDMLRNSDGYQRDKMQRIKSGESAREKISEFDGASPDRPGVVPIENESGYHPEKLNGE